MTPHERSFVKIVRAFYKAHGRHTLPWRITNDPYHILVSEVMLQQTQVDRVIPKYAFFLATFPSIEMLAQAPLGAVLRVWQGLGYNRRAKMLHACAQAIVREHGGRIPTSYEQLLMLPGIGTYTASAVCAFAYNQSVVLIETNVRSAYIHHFFVDATDVSDAAIRSIVERTNDTKQPRIWYWALMDYGSHIKKTHGNPNSRSSHYTQQSAFKGSDREIRGAIIRLLSAGPATRQRIQRITGFPLERVDAQIEKLTTEELITRRSQRYLLPE